MSEESKKAQKGVLHAPTRARRAHGKMGGAMWLWALGQQTERINH
jgi:hypothetical protein